MNAPRIAYICADPGVPVFGKKGCSIHVQEVIRALRRRGAQVQLFAARRDGNPPGDLRDLVVHTLPGPANCDRAERERAGQRANAILAGLLQKARPFDFVYERYSLWSFAGMDHARASGVPGLLEVNAPLIEEQATHRGLVDHAGAEDIAARAFNHASALVAVSDEVATYLRARAGESCAVHVIPNGVNPERFPQNLAPTWRWPENALKVKNLCIGFVGTLKPWHGVPALVEAFARLRDAFPNARLLIVGDGPERDALKTRVSELGLEGVTHFTGAVAAEQIPGLLAAMDIAVAPYPRLERFYFSPLKVYEYMAAGLAVVASRIGQLSEIIHAGRNGLLCEPGDADDLATQLLRLSGDAALRVRLGDAARQTIAVSHTWDHVAKRIFGITESCRHTSIHSAASASAPAPVAPVENRSDHPQRGVAAIKGARPLKPPARRVPV